MHYHVSDICVRICAYVVQARSVSTAVQTDQQDKHEHERTQEIHSDQILCMYAAIIEYKRGICTTNLLNCLVTFYLVLYMYIIMCTCVSVNDQKFKLECIMSYYSWFIF